MPLVDRAEKSAKAVMTQQKIPDPDRVCSAADQPPVFRLAGDCRSHPGHEVAAERALGGNFRSGSVGDADAAYRQVVQRILTAEGVAPEAVFLLGAT